MPVQYILFGKKSEDVALQNSTQYAALSILEKDKYRWEECCYTLLNY